LVRLKPRDLHAERLLIRVDQGKGRKDRYTLLSPRLLEELRAYWRAYRPQTWLFEGARTGSHLAIATAQKVFDRAKELAGVQHGNGIHCLRHYADSRIMPTRGRTSADNRRIPCFAG
jgi:integrase